MRSSYTAAGPPAAITVVGGGASGTLVAAGLLRQAAAARRPLRVTLVDRHGRHGLGQAYSTSHPHHLLNSPADRTSASADDPAHLTRWAAAHGIEHDGFLPRSSYGHYLRELLAEAERTAAPIATLGRITGEVIELTDTRRTATGAGPLAARLANGRRLHADVAVLALGHLPSAAPCPVPDTDRYIADPWAPGALERMTDGRPVTILGTGLTAMDVALSVATAHPAAIAHAISRHGLLPRAHPAPPANAVATVLPVPSGCGLPALIRQVRTAAVGAGDGWPGVVEELRSRVPELWQGLSLQEKQAFLRHVARYWEIHRHRMPPLTARRVSALLAEGRLRVLAGRVVGAHEAGAHEAGAHEAGSREAGRSLRLTVESDGKLISLRAGWLVNATGAGQDITRAPDPLLRYLLASGGATPDALRLGLAADSRGAVLDARGTAGSRIYTLGPTLRGQLYETTAIPEIRDQAAALAREIVSALCTRVAPGSAA